MYPNSLILSMFLYLLLLPALALSDSPFDSILNPSEQPATGENNQPVIKDLNSTNTIPFLQAFMIVYKGKWIYCHNDGGVFVPLEVNVDFVTCNEVKSECCGKWIFGGTEGQFCLQSTWKIILKYRDIEVLCVGMRGTEIENPMELGTAYGDPTLIDCGIFRLIRPE